MKKIKIQAVVSTRGLKNTATGEKNPSKDKREVVPGASKK